MPIYMPISFLKEVFRRGRPERELLPSYKRREIMAFRTCRESERKIKLNLETRARG